MLSPSHGWILHNTKEEGSRITELAAIAKITKQSMSALAAQLEETGYIKKKTDTTDKRAWLVILTPKGKKVKEVGMKSIISSKKNGSKSWAGKNTTNFDSFDKLW
jgi:DNA-binding MarR family transcriptional regulator